MPIKQIRQAIAVGVVVLALAGPAQADGPYGRGAYVAPPPPPTFNWTGFYLGGNVGGGWATGTLSNNLSGATLDTDHSGFVGGGQLGFNYQISNLVFGVEWDFDWTSIGDTSNRVIVPLIGTLQASSDTDWTTTLAARVGLTIERWLVYVKLGGGWVHHNATITNLTTGALASRSETRAGWLVGTGFEYALSNNWTAKLEYDVLVLSDGTVPGPLGNNFTFEHDVQMLKFGFNLKF